MGFHSATGCSQPGIVWVGTKALDAPQTRDERFEFGLDCLLDGIAVRFGLPRR